MQFNLPAARKGPALRTKDLLRPRSRGLGPSVIKAAALLQPGSKVLIGFI